MSSNIDEDGNLKWGCYECGYKWHENCFYTFIECPECGSEAICHY